MIPRDGKADVREYSHLSLGDLSPVTPVPQDHLLVVIKGYFDGGNEADNPEYPHACIAMVCGSEKQWHRFNTAWKKVLYKHGAEFLHTTDAVSLKNEFSAKYGWNDTKVDAFIGDCVKAIEKHIEVPPKIPGRKPRKGLFPVTLMIEMDDWLRARRDYPTLPNTVAEVCATESLGLCFKRGKMLGAKRWQLYYDRGEPFFGHISDRLRHPEPRKTIPLLGNVSHLGESDMRDVPALQMADLFAWCINHNHRVVRVWHRALHGLAWGSLALNYDRLISPNKAGIEITRTWKLPRRVPTEVRVARAARRKK